MHAVKKKTTLEPSCNIFKRNIMIQGVQSGRYFICQRHPDEKLKDDYYYLTSMQDSFGNVNEKITTVHNETQYKIVDFDVMVRN